MTATSQMAVNTAITLPSFHSVLRQLYPKNARKHIAQAFGVSLRRAKDIIEGLSEPRASELFRAAASDPKALAAFQNVLTEIEFARLRLAETSDKGVLASGRDVGAPRALAQPDRGLARTLAARAHPARRAA